MADFDTLFDDTLSYKVCSDVAEIVAQGYTDGIDDIGDHLELCNMINNLLPEGYFWLDGWEGEISDDDFGECELTGVGCSRLTVRAMRREERD